MSETDYNPLMTRGWTMTTDNRSCPECGGPTTPTNEGRSSVCRDHGEFVNHGPWPTEPDGDAR